MAGLTVDLPKPTILQPGEEEKQLVQGYQKESEALPTRLDPIKQQMGTLEREMGAIQSPTAPQLAPIQQFQPRQVDSGEMMTFATIATVLASLGARATRTGITGALTAAGGAIKGFSEGNIQQAKIDAQNFTTQMQATLAHNNQMLSEYQNVLADRKLTLAQKMQQYSVLAHKYSDEIAMSAVRKGDIRFELERLDKIRNASNQTELLFTKMQATIQAQLARIEGQQSMALHKPLPASDIVHYVHPQTGERPPPGMTLYDVIRGGYQVQSTNEQNRGVDSKGAFAMVDRLDELVGKVWGKGQGDEGAAWRIATGAEWAKQRVDQSNLSLSAYDSFIQGSVAPLIRSLGEKGTLATEDVQRALAFLPNTGREAPYLPDTPQLAKEKLSQLRNLLKEATSPRGAGGGGGGDAQIRQLLQSAGSPYEPQKYDYRVLNGQVQRRPRGR